ncbi:unnamed protein product [Amoebophrya sp. A25]|nr:unnamed protein product [Amoebophrya sp. A25]|eukprot:GSA25T00010301001.1
MKLACGPNCQHLQQIAIQVTGYEILGQQEAGASASSPSAGSPAFPSIASRVTSAITQIQNRVTQYVVYDVRIEAESLSWQKRLRFSDFSSLFELLQSRYNNLPVELFPKKTLVRSVEASHLETRVRQLNEFFLVICRNRLDILRTCVELWELFDFHIECPEIFGTLSATRSSSSSGGLIGSSLYGSNATADSDALREANNAVAPSARDGTPGALYRESIPLAAAQLQDAHFGVRDFYLDQTSDLLILAANDYSLQSRVTVAAEGSWKMVKEGVTSLWSQVSSASGGLGGLGSPGSGGQGPGSGPVATASNNPMYGNATSANSMDANPFTSSLGAVFSSSTPASSSNWRASLHRSQDSRPLSSLTCYRGTSDFSFEQVWRLHFPAMIQSFSCSGPGGVVFAGLKDGRVGFSTMRREKENLPLGTLLSTEADLVPGLHHNGSVSALVAVAGKIQTGEGAVEGAAEKSVSSASPASSPASDSSTTPNVPVLAGSSASSSSSSRSDKIYLYSGNNIDGKLAIYDFAEKRLLAEMLLPLPDAGSVAPGSCVHYATQMRVHGQHLFVGTNFGMVVVFSGAGTPSLQLHSRLMTEHVREAMQTVLHALDGVWKSPVAVRDLVIEPEEEEGAAVGELGVVDEVDTSGGSRISSKGSSTGNRQEGQEDIFVGARIPSGGASASLDIVDASASPQSDYSHLLRRRNTQALRVFVALRDGVQVWRFPDCRQIGYQSKSRDALPLEDTPVRCCGLRRQTQELFLAFEDGTIASYDLDSGHQLSVFLAHKGGAVTSLKFAQSGDYMLTSGKDKTMTIWRCPFGETALLREAVDLSSFGWDQDRDRISTPLGVRDEYISCSASSPNTDRLQSDRLQGSRGRRDVASAPFT